MTVNYSSGNDIIVPTSNNESYRGLDGDDIYIISNAIPKQSSITIIDTSGKKFDPNFHQAMSEIEDDKVDSGTILQEIQAQSQHV